MPPGTPRGEGEVPTFSRRRVTPVRRWRPGQRYGHKKEVEAFTVLAEASQRDPPASICLAAAAVPSARGDYRSLQWLDVQSKAGIFDLDGADPEWPVAVWPDEAIVNPDTFK